MSKSQPRSASIIPAAGRTRTTFAAPVRTLVDVLAHQLGPSFTAEVADAWTSACEMVGQMVLEPRHSYAA